MSTSHTTLNPINHFRVSSSFRGEIGGYLFNHELPYHASKTILKALQHTDYFAPFANAISVPSAKEPALAGVAQHICEMVNSFYDLYVIGQDNLLAYSQIVNHLQSVLSLVHLLPSNPSKEQLQKLRHQMISAFLQQKDNSSTDIQQLKDDLLATYFGDVFWCLLYDIDALAS